MLIFHFEFLSFQPCSFKSLTLSTAFKSLSDSKLDCTSKIDHLKQQHQQQQKQKQRNQLVVDNGSEAKVIKGTFIHIKTGILPMQELSMSPNMSEGLVIKQSKQNFKSIKFVLKKI